MNHRFPALPGAAPRCRYANDSDPHTASRRCRPFTTIATLAPAMITTHSSNRSAVRTCNGETLRLASSCGSRRKAIRMCPAVAALTAATGGNNDETKTRVMAISIGLRCRDRNPAASDSSPRPAMAVHIVRITSNASAPSASRGAIFNRNAV